MATYNNLPNSELNAEQPVTQDKMHFLNENPKSVAENAASVPTEQLQLAEGMRTSMPDGSILRASNGFMVQATENEAYSDVGNAVAASTAITLTGTYMAWGQSDAGGNGSSAGICLIEAGAITFQNNIYVTGSIAGSLFSIVGSTVEYNGGGSNINNLMVLKVK